MASLSMQRLIYSKLTLVLFTATDINSYFSGLGKSTLSLAACCLKLALNSCMRCIFVLAKANKENSAKNHDEKSA